MKFKLLFSLFIISSILKSQIPAGYYDAANGKTGYELKTALKNIITNGHNDQGYDALYTLYQSSDVDNYYENDQTLLDMYSEKPSGADSYEYTQTGDKCGSYSNEGDCYNREHLMPQSVFGSASPMKNDGHFVVPADGKVNGERSNYAFGIVTNPTWTSTNGSKVGPNATAGYSDTVFEPIDEFKGDIARMLFYFATRYEDQVASWSHPMLNGTSDQVFSDWFLDILLQWNTDDPVNQREIDRNEAVYNYQGNRNPYIDHPEWVNEVWNSQNNGNGGGAGNGNPSASQVIAIQDFDGTTPDWSYTENDGGYNCFNIASGYQSNATNSLQIKGTNKHNADPFIELANIDLTSYNNVKLWVSFAANGPDSQDDLYIDYSFDNGSSWTSVKLVDGYSNADLNFGDTNASDPTTVSPNPYSIDIPDTETQIMVRIRFDERSGKNNTSDFYYVDDIKLEGDAASSTDEPDWCNLQFPASGNIRTGNGFNVYAQVYEPGVTDSSGQGAGISAWIGYSSVDNDPTNSANDANWTWVAATYNTDSGNNDEYMVDLENAINASGIYYYASRFQLNGGPYKYGGYNSSGGGFWDSTYSGSGTNKSGKVTIDDIDWCNLQSPENGNITAPGNSFVVFAQIFEDGLTNADANNPGAGIQAWIGYSTVDNDPSDSANAADWTWLAATYNADSGNNDEFKADLGSSINVGGTYYYASRFQINGGSYAYGGYNGGFWQNTYSSAGVNKSGQLTVNDIYITNISNSPTNITSSDTVNITADVSADAGVAGVELHWGTVSGSLTNTINMSLTSGDTYTADSDIPAQADGTIIYYEIYALDNNSEEKTSSEQSYTVSDACASELIISEYIDGSSNNKYLEFYNGTGNTVNMEDYDIRIYSNASTTVSSTIHLDNTNLADGDVYVLANSSATAWSGTPDQISGSLGFNGNDAIELYNTATTQSVDIIGKIGQDPGSSGWGSGSTSTADHTLVRKSTITSGDIDGTDAFDPAVEWDGYVQDDVSHLGSHTMTCGPCAEPTADATFHANSPQSITTTSLTLNWTNGDGDNRIVVLREANPVTFVPVDGTTYSGNSDYSAATDVSGNGEFVVYNGNGSTVDVTGLTPGTLYYAVIYEYNCAPGSEDYFTSGTPATDSFYTTPEKPDSFTAGCIGAISIDLSWTAPATGNFDGYLLVAREGATPHSVNSLDPNTNLGENTDYSAAATYGSTTPNSHILYKGTNTSVTITGLTNNTEYTFEVFAYSANGTLYRYSTGKTTTQTVLLQNVSDAHASPGNTKATVYWINPASCYDEVLVVANETAGIDFTPFGDGSTYTANANYSAANQVVYKGTGNNLIVNNLTNGTAYYFEIFVRKGTEWSSGIEVSTTPVDATKFQPGQLVFVGYDGQYKGSGPDDEYLIATLIDIEPGTTFSLVNSRYEAGAPANVRTDKWGGGGNDASVNPGVAEITYKGTNNIPAGSVLRLHTLYSTIFLDYVGVITGTTETDRTADFSASLIYGTSAVPNISASGSDQLFLVQGVFIFDGSADSQQANYNLQGTLLHGITNRAAWVPITNACNGDSSGGNTRESRLHPSLNCFNVEYSDVSAISGFYQNDEVHSGSFRDLILGISDGTHWTLGTDRYNLDPSTTDETDAGHTFTITGGHNPGTWVSTTDTNWFNCSNWETLAVPDATTDVALDANSSVNAVIDANATYAELFNGQAVCHNLSISNLSVVAEGTGALIVNGNLDIIGSGVLDADDNDNATPDADISIFGDMTTANANSFLEGNSSVNFVGTTAQTVSCNSGNDTEAFYNLEIDNPAGVTFSSGNIHAEHNLNILQDTPIDINDGHYLLAGYNLVNNTDITIKNQGSLVQTDDSGSITGTGTFKMNKTSLPLNHYYDYVYWSSPINSLTFTLGDIVSGAWRYYKYDPNEANNGHTYPSWVMLSASDVPEAGSGYAVSAPTNAAANTILPVHFVKEHDPFNNGVISKTVLRKGGPDNNGNYNLLGNPYPSAIDFDALANDVENDAVANAYSLWTNCAGLNTSTGHHQASGYATYVTSGTGTNACPADQNTVANRYIASGQGFMIEANTDGGTMKFKNTYRVTDQNTHFLNRPSQNRDIVWLDMSDDIGNFSQIAVGFYPGATSAYDDGYDAHSMNAGSGFALYSLVNNEKLVIQGLPRQNIEEQVVPLGLETAVTGEITLHLDHTEGFDAYDIYLKDNTLNTIQDLKTADYTINLPDGIHNDRFELVFARALQVPEQSIDNQILLMQDKGQFKLLAQNDLKIDKVQVFDITGQLIFEKQAINQSGYFIDLHQIATGNVLIFKIMTKKHHMAVKKAVKM